jgi:hypothetical protein
VRPSGFQLLGKEDKVATKRIDKDEKHVGDVIGVSRSRVKAPIESKGTGRRRAPAIAPSRAGSGALKRAGVVGGVRGRGR